MKHRYSILFFPLHVIIDFLSLNAAFLGAYWIKFKAFGLLPTEQYELLWGIFNVIWLVEILIVKPYIYPRQLFKSGHLVKQLLSLAGIHIAVIAVFWIAVKGYYYSREQLLLTYLIFVGLGTIVRVGSVFFIREYRARGYNNRRFIIVGYGKLANTIRAFYDAHPEMGFHFCGYFDNYTLENAPYLYGDYDSLLSYIRTNHVDCVYCCMPYMDSKQIKMVVDNGIELDYQTKLLVDFRGFFAKGASVEYHDFLPILNLSSQQLADFRISFFKRSFDILFSSAVLLFGAPVFLLIALTTKLTSEGPVIFAQRRYGRLGQVFTIYKFRSMYTKESTFTIGLQHSQGKHDPRITPWGGFMRRTRLDELPQFMNVLLGQMSIVGPRPLAQYDVETLMEEVPIDFQKILTVKPGITSIGQVKFGYAVDIDEMIQRLRYDLTYSDRRSFVLDMWIIAQTLKVMIQGRGK